MAVTPANTPESDPALFALFTEIGIIAQLSQALLERRLPDGLKISQFGVLQHLARRGQAQNPVHMARAFQVTKGAMTNTVTRLAARKLVDIAPDPADGRAKLVSINAAGRKVRADAVTALQPALAALRNGLGAGVATDLLPALEALRIYLDNNRDLP